MPNLVETGTEWAPERIEENKKIGRIEQALVFYGARTRNRTGIPVRVRDFKSLASTSFAIRAQVAARRES